MSTNLPPDATALIDQQIAASSAGLNRLIALYRTLAAEHDSAAIFLSMVRTITAEAEPTSVSAALAAAVIRLATTTDQAPTHDPIPHRRIRFPRRRSS
ncbi:hypothetical protein [Mycolicibacterium sphagni]|uniref:hypothetical protein n=1 Tax=Mycolicibacterium sphagni TaxID=1786 RepID=UPI0021F37A25|nr:hypothetical protein [Mycolicibacterium sphagni]MCV7175096.1 hypothetical protein [Mycolicibacterium sphagni]